MAWASCSCCMRNKLESVGFWVCKYFLSVTQYLTYIVCHWHGEYCGIIVDKISLSLSISVTCFRWLSEQLYRPFLHSVQWLQTMVSKWGWGGQKYNKCMNLYANCPPQPRIETIVCRYQSRMRERSIFLHFISRFFSHGHQEFMPQPFWKLVL